jgi:hypothetical protein
MQRAGIACQRKSGVPPCAPQQQKSVRVARLGTELANAAGKLGGNALERCFGDVLRGAVEVGVTLEHDEVAHPIVIGDQTRAQRVA